MKLYTKQNKKRPLVGGIVSALVFAAIAVMLYIGIQEMFASSQDESFNSTRDAIANAISNCYAMEGRYPPDMEYLQENYGVVIDPDIYVVNYQSGFGFVRPEVELIRIGG